MPVYESIKNADNRIVISAQNKDSVVFGWDKVAAALAALVKGGKKNIAIDGWYGIDFEKIAKAVADKVEGASVVLIGAEKLFKSREEIIAYNQPFVTDDPGFGKVNKVGVVEDIMAPAAIESVKKELERKDGQVVIIYGVGASIKAFADLVDVKCYVDNTHQKVQWDMWTGKLATFGATEPTKNYHWKEYNYSDYYILKRQKDYMYEAMDFYIENYFENDLVLVPRKAYDEIMSTLVKYPIHEVKIFSPGPWGAYRYHDMDYGVEGLANNAWNKIAGPELCLLEYSTVFDVAQESQVSFFVTLFSDGDVAVHDSDCRETFCIGYISKVRIVGSPFFVFTSSSSLQVFSSSTDDTSRIRSSDFYHATFQPLEHTLGVFLFLVGSFGEDSRNLFVTFLLCYACKVCIYNKVESSHMRTD